MIDGKIYYTNYVTDVSSLNLLTSNIGKMVYFQAVGLQTNYPLIVAVSGYSADPGSKSGFVFFADTPTSCIQKGTNFEIYVGYYKNGVLDSRIKDYICVVSDDNIFDAIPGDWHEEFGQKYIIKAKNTGYSTITIITPSNNDATSLEIYVVEGENGYTFDGIPKMTVEEGKTTTFYNYSGMVVDDFTATPLADKTGEIKSYEVTITIYNTLNLYGAVTVFNAEGDMKG